MQFNVKETKFLIEKDWTLDEQKRSKNEHKFENWQELSNGGRRYWLNVDGRFGWVARYIKEVDADEKIIRFHQEIYNEKGELVEIHQKYPEDKGHQKVMEK